LFVLPWGSTWILGTTDTPWSHDFAHPVATHADVDYLLTKANALLTSDLAESDVVGTYAGLRPLLDDEGTESELSREHVLRRPRRPARGAPPAGGPPRPPAQAGRPPGCGPPPPPPSPPGPGARCRGAPPGRCRGSAPRPPPPSPARPSPGRAATRSPTPPSPA